MIIDKTRGNPIPPFLIIAPKEAPIKKRKIQAKIIEYLSLIVNLCRFMSFCCKKNVFFLFVNCLKYT